MAASMIGRSYTHTSVQCSPASVGLAQARPNYMLGTTTKLSMPFQVLGCSCTSKKNSSYTLGLTVTEINIKKVQK